MKPSYEKLVPSTGESFRCFDRSVLRSPVKWHRHPEIELTYVEKGSGSRLVGDSIESYRDHDLVLLGSNLPHTWASDEFRERKYDRHRSTVLQFHPAFLSEQFFELEEVSEIATLLQRASRGIWFPPPISIAIGDRIKAIVGMVGMPRLIELLSCLHDLSVANDTRYLASKSYSLTTTQESETRIQRVCDHIAHQFTDSNLSHQSIAEMVQMNPSAFSRFFRQSTGRTVTQHITELRIGLACRRLIESDESILSISLDSGFSNLSNFNRRFRELRHMTPRAYRTHHHMNN